MALAVLGLILSIALAGELLRLSVKPDVAAAWFVFVGLVLFVAQVFSDILGRAVAKRSEPGRSELLDIGVRDLSILVGPLGFVVALLGANTIGVQAGNVLIAAISAGLVVVGALSYYAASAYRPLRRVLLSSLVVAACALIVIAENIV